MGEAAEERRVVARWGIGELPALAGDRPLVVASPRWRDVRRCGSLGGGALAPDRGSGGRRHDRRDRRRQRDRHGQGRVGRERAAARVGADDVLGAEWTSFFGVRDPGRRMRGGGAGAHLHAIVYEPQLTLGLPSPRRSARR